VGLFLRASKSEAVARYALEGLPNKVRAAEYRTTLPEEKMIAAEIERRPVLSATTAPTRRGAKTASRNSRLPRPVRGCP
jgi:hypothetical protein